MNTEARDLVVAITRGIDHELSSAGLKVSIFLTNAGVDAADAARPI